MPVPNARILNPFVPRDDLGIEEDISNKIYLPSDVSLSLATMVGRNGRKPRIVQMDDDGSIFVSIPSKSKSNTLDSYTVLASSETINAGVTFGKYDLRGKSFGQITAFCTNTDELNGRLLLKANFYGLDKTSRIAESQVFFGVGDGSTLVIGPAWLNGFWGPYLSIDITFPEAGTFADISLEMYLG